MPNPSRRPSGTSRNPYEFTPEERAAFGQEVSYPDPQQQVWASGGGGSGGTDGYSAGGSARWRVVPNLISAGASASQFEDQVRAFIQGYSPAPPLLPQPTENPRRVIDAAVRDAVVDLQLTCHLRVRHRMMPDLYASPNQLTEMHKQMEVMVFREMSDQLKKKIRFTVIPTIQDYGKTVEAEVVIMSPAELQAFGESVARQVIDACITQGYFR